MENTPRQAVRPKPHKTPAVAALPQTRAEPQQRLHDQRVIDLVEVPFVEQEEIKYIVLARELDGKIGPSDVEMPRHQKSDGHHQRRQPAHGKRHVMHPLDDLATLLERLSEKFLDVMARKIFFERQTSEDRAC